MLKRDAQTTLNESFIGKQAEDLGRLIGEQIKPLYLSLGIEVPVKSCSIIHALDQCPKISLTELAKYLNQSHQLIKQKLPKLLKLNLITQQAAPDDKRKTHYQLTEAGQKQADLLRQYSMSAVYQELSAEVGGDLFAILQTAIQNLQQVDLSTRFYRLQEQTNDK